MNFANPLPSLQEENDQWTFEYDGVLKFRFVFFAEDGMIAARLPALMQIMEIASVVGSSIFFSAACLK